MYNRERRNSEYGQMMRYSSHNSAVMYFSGPALQKTVVLREVIDEAETIIQVAAGEEPTTDGE